MFEWFNAFLDWAGVWRFSSFLIGFVLVVGVIKVAILQQKLERLQNKQRQDQRSTVELCP